jgi:hypothetical protein
VIQKVDTVCIQDVSKMLRQASGEISPKKKKKTVEKSSYQYASANAYFSRYNPTTY